MSHEERSGVRDLLYSGWHRPSRIRRFMKRREAAMLEQIDIDWCEYCCYCKEPVALIETERSASTPKPARVTTRLAQLAELPAYSVSYQPTADGSDIEMFRVRQLAPAAGPVQKMLPVVYAYWLLSLRDGHHCPGKLQEAAS